MHLSYIYKNTYPAVSWDAHPLPSPVPPTVPYGCLAGRARLLQLARHLGHQELLATGQKEGTDHCGFGRPVTIQRMATIGTSDQWEFQDPFYGGTNLVPYFRAYSLENSPSIGQKHMVGYGRYLQSIAFSQDHPCRSRGRLGANDWALPLCVRKGGAECGNEDGEIGAGYFMLCRWSCTIVY